jgi:PLP dependent protein
MLEENLNHIKSRIDRACKKAGKAKEDITLLAVTKTVPVEVINKSIVLGITDIGENKVQEAAGKFSALSGNVKKHYIGHLQTNKVKKAVELFDIIQSIDSLHLAEEIQKTLEKSSKTMECFIELKVSGEESKFGVNSVNAGKLIDEVIKLKNIKLTGFMAMAPYFDNPEDARPYFKTAKEIFDKYKSAGLKHLSMGMSNDFETAIEEGANIVRIGTALFGERKYE